jgi:hypothetical protein
MPSALAAKFRGRLSFAEGQLFDRAAALMLPAYRARASGKDSLIVMTSTIERELKRSTAILKSAVPRCLVAAESRHPLLFFTDASLADSSAVADYGGVVIDRDSGTTEFFSEIASRTFLSSLHWVLKE